MWISFAPYLFVSPRHPWRGGFIQKSGEEEKKVEECALRRNRKFMFINAMRLRRSRQGFNSFILPLFFWACLRQATGAICAGISHKIAKIRNYHRFLTTLLFSFYFNITDGVYCLLYILLMLRKGRKKDIMEGWEGIY